MCGVRGGGVQCIMIIFLFLFSFRQEIVSKIREYNLYKIKAVEKFKHVEVSFSFLL